jgi:hypothetical protein
VFSDGITRPDMQQETICCFLLSGIVVRKT